MVVVIQMPRPKMGTLLSTRPASELDVVCGSYYTFRVLLPVYKANIRGCDCKDITEGVLLTVASSAYYHLHTLSVNYLVITVVQ